MPGACLKMWSSRRGAASSVRGAFHRRWHVAGSLGRSEEFKRKDQPGPPLDTPRCDSQFSWGRRSNDERPSRLSEKAKGHEAKLAYLGEVLTNPHGLVVDASVVSTTGTADRAEAASFG